MKKQYMRKSILCGLVIFGLIFCGFAVSADETVTDGADDVWHYFEESPGSWSWESGISDKSSIDLTEVSYEINNDDLTVTLTANELIDDSDLVIYLSLIHI